MKVKSVTQLIDNKIIDLNINEFEPSTREWELINIYDVENGIFDSFGGAITYSTAYNYSLLSKEDKNKVLELLASETGLKYKKFRLCIGSSDFATHDYCYIKDNDYDLTTFNIKEDEKYIIPFIKDLISYTKGDISFFASPWSPPAFMKSNNIRFQGGVLKEECYELYAKYIIKFLLAYLSHGIKIDALTIQNEPKAKQSWESCQFDSEQETKLAQILKKCLIDNNLNYVKLYIWDHNKERLVERTKEVMNICPDIIDGVSFHWYSGEHFSSIDVIKKLYPNLDIMESEFCVSYGYDEVELRYGKEIINNIAHGTNSIVEWNMILDDDGGPYHNRYSQTKAGCEAPIIFDKKENKIRLGTTYLDTFMISNYLESGAKILMTSSFNSQINTLAFKNPNGDIGLVILNNSNKTKTGIYYKKHLLNLSIPKDSITTLIFEE